jgi:hypothetical protein
MPVASTDRIEKKTLLSSPRLRVWKALTDAKEFGHSGEPTTLILFSLEEAAGGIMLTVTESGFDRIPLARRAKRSPPTARAGRSWSG